MLPFLVAEPDNKDGFNRLRAKILLFLGYIMLCVSTRKKYSVVPQEKAQPNILDSILFAFTVPS